MRECVSDEVGRVEYRVARSYAPLVHSVVLRTQYMAVLSIQHNVIPGPATNQIWQLFISAIDNQNLAMYEPCSRIGNIYSVPARLGKGPGAK